VLHLAGREYALPLDRVVEVVRIAALAPVPDAPAFVLGLLNLRGRVVPVMDLRLRLGLQAAEPGLSTPICVFEAAGRAFGLIADRVTGVRRLSAPVERLEVVADDSAVAGVTEIDGRLVSLLDPERLARAVPPAPAGEPARVGMDR
jgi:purine-binding chemotaxis protein CheW